MNNIKSSKTGLGLSGGGFRASLFHIGVLASLAEYNLLRDIQVISCVSGGSIIGAYYYLHLKKLLESKEDSEITREDYINLIKEIETDFLKEVQTNLRVQALSSLKSNFKMLFQGDTYSRSDRMAELYDRHFHNKFLKYFGKNPDETISIRELIINPFRSNIGPDIRSFNISRKNKVPMLILNATTLNTGRNWQFTAVDMGERDVTSSEREDDNRYNISTLFKAFKFDGPEIKRANPKYLHFPLRIAVAASACVPGLFAPLALTDLYDSSVPQLVDGGVFDNQGISPILWEMCDEIIISDASGQMDFIENTRNDPIGVTTRSNSIMMNRIRNLQFEYLDYKFSSKSVSKEIFLHLREDLEPRTILPGGKFKTEIKSRSSNTYYGINREVQLLLSKVRTDLDSFSDIEAYSLMYSGYRMTQAKVVRNGFAESGAVENAGWDFLKIREYCGGRENKRFMAHLVNSQETIFKSSGYSFMLMFLEVLIVLFSILIAFIPLIVVSAVWFKETIFWIITGIYIATFTIFLLSCIIRFFKSIKKNIIFRVSTIVISFFVATSGWVVSRLYLIFVNKIFNRLGRIETLAGSR